MSDIKNDFIDSDKHEEIFQSLIKWFEEISASERQRFMWKLTEIYCSHCWIDLSRCQCYETELKELEKQIEKI